ncbi:hypothetical protein A1Q2_00661 [Trichosporon asahii var. asahii CBS 8904]|uniref:F-box domain-containing protein n=1 Tax=Trichosporon asahii var. asahii (strain CBS 8904) TaxID=1220162 RepID=K1WWC6_TRIAC|nr:hypothetical protein A1Q2_00661 [Trichosporon asahii var. asahii CBS 8904]
MVSSTPAFDAAFYPHLLDLIVDSASPELLLSLRQTCTRLRDRVQAVLKQHLIFDRRGGRTLYGGLWEDAWSSGVSTEVLDLGEGNDWAASSGALTRFASGAEVDILRTFSDVSAGIRSRRVYYFASPAWGAYVTPHLVPRCASLEMLVVNVPYETHLPSIDHMRTQAGYEYLNRGLECLGTAERVVILFSPRTTFTPPRPKRTSGSAPYQPVYSPSPKAVTRPDTQAPPRPEVDGDLRTAHFKEVDDLAQTILRSGLSTVFELVGTEQWTFPELERAADESKPRNLQHKVWIDMVESERAKHPHVPVFEIMLRAVLRFYAVSDHSRHLASVAMAGPLPTTTVEDRYQKYLARIVFTTRAAFKAREGERQFRLMTERYPGTEGGVGLQGRNMVKGTAQVTGTSASVADADATASESPPLAHSSPPRHTPKETGDV